MQAGYAVEVEGLDVLQLPDNPEQGPTDQLVGGKDGERCDGESQEGEHDEQELCVLVDRSQEITGRNDGRHYPIAKVQRCERDEVCSAVGGVSEFDLTLFGEHIE